jgi:hypothetical protein
MQMSPPTSSKINPRAAKIWKLKFCRKTKSRIAATNPRNVNPFKDTTVQSLFNFF